MMQYDSEENIRQSEILEDQTATYTLVMSYEGSFEIYFRDGRYFYLEDGEDYAIPVRLIAELASGDPDNYSCTSEKLINLFDCFCCGEAISGCNYLWFDEE